MSTAKLLALAALAAVIACRPAWARPKRANRLWQSRVQSRSAPSHCAVHSKPRGNALSLPASPTDSASAPRPARLPRPVTGPRRHLSNSQSGTIAG